MTFDQLGEPEEVAPERSGQLRRLVLSLVGVGVLIGLIVAAGSWVFGTFSQTEQGLCRVTVAPCVELSLASVEQLSGLDLPDGTEVLSGYAQELGTLHEFRAEVLLPVDGSVTMSSAYDEATDLVEVPDAARGLAEQRYWTRPIQDGTGHDLAVVGSRDGRTVIVFDERTVPAP